MQKRRPLRESATPPLRPTHYAQMRMFMRLRPMSRAVIFSSTTSCRSISIRLRIILRSDLVSTTPGLRRDVRTLLVDICGSLGEIGDDRVANKGRDACKK